LNADKQCHGVLLQFHDFIVSNLDLASFERLLPPFEGIVKDYGIEPPVAFYLWRPILSEKIKQHDVDLSIQLQKKKLLRDLAASEQSTEATDEKPKSSSTNDENGMSNVPQEALPASTDHEVDHIAEPNEKSSGTEVEEYSPVSTLCNNTSPWHPALHGFIEEAGRVVTSEVWNYMR
jgi:THO complex subunit 2